MYELIYGDDGKVSVIKKGLSYIPICDANSDYQEFLEWNKQQKTPLDLKSTIAVKIQTQPTQAELLSEFQSLLSRASEIEARLK
jgi:hypothetical protein